MAKLNSKIGLTAVAGLLTGVFTTAQASWLSDNITNLAVNTFEDQSREAYFDINGNGLFDTGDVLTGFIKIDNKSAPDAIDVENHVYAIFTQEVKNINGFVIEFGPVTVGSGLSLSELGVAGAGANDMVAVYSAETVPTGFSVDLITTSPGDRTGGGITLADYFDVILDEGTLDILAGVYDQPSCSGGTADCFQATSIYAGGPNSLFINAPDSVSVANFIAGLETSLDPGAFTLTDTVPSGTYFPPAAPLTISELAISNGAARGSASSANNQEWINGSELSASLQCTDASGAAQPCGFINDADFTFEAVAVPEPATIALLGGGLLGLSVVRRKRRS